MRVQVTLNAENLRNTKRRRLRLADPYAVVRYTNGPYEGQEVGRTETIENTLNPTWVKVLFADIDPALFMPFRVSVFDENVNREDTLMAEADFEMTEVFNSPGNTQCREQIDGIGTIHVNVEESVRGSAIGTFNFHIRGLDIKNVESGPLGLGRSDPFFVISKKNSDYDRGIVRWNPVYRSEHIIVNLNPYFKKFTMSLEELCYCDLEWPLRVTVYDWNSNGKHRNIGKFDTNVKTLLSRVSKNGNADRESAFELFKDGRETKRGLVVVLEADIKLE